MGPEGAGAGLWIGAAQGVTVENTIIAASTQGQAITCHVGIVMMSCNDIFGNAGGDYVGCISGSEGVDGNISADPQFCDAGGEAFTLNAASPCAPANAPPGCGLIGAFDVGCGQAAIEEGGVAAARPLISLTPNPVWSSAQIAVRGPMPGRIIEIITTAGRVIDALRADAGGGITWHPSRDLPSGVYFARLRGGETGTARFVLIR